MPRPGFHLYNCPICGIPFIAKKYGKVRKCHKCLKKHTTKRKMAWKKKKRMEKRAQENKD